MDSKDSKKDRPGDVVKYKKLLEEGYDEAEAGRIAGVSAKGDPDPGQDSGEMNATLDPNSDVKRS